MATWWDKAKKSVKETVNGENALGKALNPAKAIYDDVQWKKAKAKREKAEGEAKVEEAKTKQKSDYERISSKMKDDAGSFKAKRNEQSEKYRTVRDTMTGDYRKNRSAVDDRVRADDKDYLDKFTGEANKNTENVSKNEGNFRGELSALKSRSAGDEDRLRKDYDTEINPRLKSQMDARKQDASSAMSLKEAGDVNNSVHKGVRGLYDERGAGARRQGLADYGMLAALGSQATSNAGGPMTGAQLQNVQAANNRQAGSAYNNALQRSQSLEDEGINRGFDESSRQYDRGVSANMAYDNSVNNYQNAGNSFNSQAQGMRGEQSGYAGGMRDSSATEESARSNNVQAVMGTQRGIQQADTARSYGNNSEDFNQDMTNKTSDYNETQNFNTQDANTQKGFDDADLAQSSGVAQNMRQDGYATMGKVEAGKAADNAQNTAILSTAGSVVGSVYGGPAGGAAGGAAGKAAGDAAGDSNSAYEEVADDNIAQKGVASKMRPA
jgi:hypothetical protein